MDTHVVLAVLRGAILSIDLIACLAEYYFRHNRDIPCALRCVNCLMPALALLRLVYQQRTSVERVKGSVKWMHLEVTPELGKHGHSVRRPLGLLHGHDEARHGLAELLPGKLPIGNGLGAANRCRRDPGRGAVVVGAHGERLVVYLCPSDELRTVLRVRAIPRAADDQEWGCICPGSSSAHLAALLCIEPIEFEPLIGRL